MNLKIWLKFDSNHRGTYNDIGGCTNITYVMCINSSNDNESSETRFYVLIFFWKYRVNSHEMYTCACLVGVDERRLTFFTPWYPILGCKFCNRKWLPYIHAQIHCQANHESPNLKILHYVPANIDLADNFLKCTTMIL